MSILLAVAIICGAIWLAGTLVESRLSRLAPAAGTLAIICFVAWLLLFGAVERWRWRWW